MFELDLRIFYAETLNHKNRERKRYDCMENEMMSSEMAGLLSLGLVLDGWLFTGPLDKAFPSVFFGVCFLVFDILVCLYFFVIVSLSKFLYTFLVFRIPRFLQRVLQHRKVCTFCCFWCSRISFCPLVSLHYSHSFFFSFN